MGDSETTLKYVACSEDWNERKEKFARILEKARGERTITKFAVDSAISPAYLSRLLREKIDIAPPLSAIIKFANASENRVSYEEILEVAGITVRESVHLKNSEDLISELKFIEKKCNRIVENLKNNSSNLSSRDLQDAIESVKKYASELSAEFLVANDPDLSEHLELSNRF